MQIYKQECQNQGLNGLFSPQPPAQHIQPHNLFS